ncbi:MAG: N-acetylneuraminate synthase [Thermodesulfobacteriota bacterium]|nr:N-acetylneuraminate synthase [Thermodesulfobacteriota bacterium]
MSQCIDIDGRKVGYGNPCFFIAEAGVNHNGKTEMAKLLIDVAQRAGADAVKFQTFNPEKLVSPGANKAEYQLQTTDRDETQMEMLQRLMLHPESYRELQSYCRNKGILFISTPFDDQSADFLADMAVPVFKISSGDINNWPFLEHVAGKGKPIILSTGMSRLSEVDEAVRVIRRSGCNQLLLLHCVSNYPAHPGDTNLRAMKTIKDAFQTPTGFSDHTPGNEVALAAVAMGACVIEKHFTLDKNLPGPDHRASLEPVELSALVKGIRIVESAMGSGLKEAAATEANTALSARKSLFAAYDLPAGTVLTEDMIAIRRPGDGLPPNMLSFVVKHTLRNEVKEGTILRLEMLS